MVEVKGSDDFWVKEANDQALVASLSFGPFAFAFSVWYKLHVIETEKKSS